MELEAIMARVKRLEVMVRLLKVLLAMAFVLALLAVWVTTRAVARLRAAVGVRQGESEAVLVAQPEPGRAALVLQSGEKSAPQVIRADVDADAKRSSVTVRGDVSRLDLTPAGPSAGAATATLMRTARGSMIELRDELGAVRVVLGTDGGHAWMKLLNPDGSEAWGVASE